MHRAPPATNPCLSTTNCDTAAWRSHRGSGGSQTPPCKRQTSADSSAACEPGRAEEPPSQPQRGAGSPRAAHRCSLPSAAPQPPGEAGGSLRKALREAAGCGARGAAGTGMPEAGDASARGRGGLARTAAHRPAAERAKPSPRREKPAATRTKAAPRTPQIPPSLVPRGRQRRGRTVGSSGSICAPWSWVSMRRRGRGGGGCALPGLRGAARLRWRGGRKRRSHGCAPRRGGRQGPDPPAGCGRGPPPPPAAGEAGGARQRRCGGSLHAALRLRRVLGGPRGRKGGVGPPGSAGA